MAWCMVFKMRAQYMYFNFNNIVLIDCSSGQFYSEDTEECVTECPCGQYGSWYQRLCRNGRWLQYYVSG